MKNSPVRYTPSIEKPEKDEAKVADELIETMLSISKKTYEDGHHAMRSVHVKSHGILQGELQVLDNLPPQLAQGMFANARTYPVIMRLSTTPGDILPDSVSTPRGLAVKVIGVEGERLPGSENAVTQDYVMVNGPAFQVANAKAFLGNLKLLAKTTDKGEGAKVALSTVMRGAGKALEAVGGGSGKIKSMGGEPATNPLGETYFTQVPMLYGEYMAKLAIAPISQNLTSLKGEKIDIGRSPTAIREALLKHFATNGGEWEVRIQLCTDLEKMPIEDAKKLWPEDESPYIAVARITVKPQIAWDEQRSAAVDDGMSFSPWHGLAAHRPIGSIMRVRKMAYEKSAAFRAKRNNKPMQEPRSIDGIFK